MKTLVALMMGLLFLILPVSAAGQEELLQKQREQLGVDKLEEAAREFLGNSQLMLDQSLEENLGVLWDTGQSQIGGILKRALRSGVMILAVILLCGVGQSLFPQHNNMSVSLVGVLAVSSIAVGDVQSLLGMGKQLMETMVSFSNILLPVVAGVTTATGAITGGAARQMAAVLFSNLLTNLFHQLLLPLLYGYLAALIAWSALGNPGLKRVCDLLKWMVVTLLSIIMLSYVSYLTLTGVVAGAADGASIKAAKFAISGAVPVVGRILSDAAETMLAGAGLLRGAVGIFGTVVIVAICLIPFLQLAIHYLIYKMVAALTATVGEGRICGLVEGIGGAFGLLLGMTGSSSLLLLISLVSSVTVMTV